MGKDKKENFSTPKRPNSSARSGDTVGPLFTSQTHSRGPRGVEIITVESHRSNHVQIVEVPS